MPNPLALDWEKRRASVKWKRTTVTIVIWQGLCLLLAYTVPLARSFDKLYVSMLGMPSPDSMLYWYGSRLSLLFWGPLPATWLSAELYRRLLGTRRTFLPIAKCVALWQGLVCVLGLCAQRFGLGWHVNMLLWDIFGDPDSLFGWRNLVLPAAITWLLYSVPAALVGLRYLDRLLKQTQPS